MSNLKAKSWIIPQASVHLAGGRKFELLAPRAAKAESSEFLAVPYSMYGMPML